MSSICPLLPQIHLFVHSCVFLLLLLQREGLFRVPGDQTVLTLCPRRFRDKECTNILFVDAFHELSEEDINPTVSSAASEEKEAATGYGTGGRGGGRGAEAGAAGSERGTATVVVDDVDVVAQVPCRSREGTFVPDPFEPPPTAA